MKKLIIKQIFILILTHLSVAYAQVGDLPINYVDVNDSETLSLENYSEVGLDPIIPDDFGNISGWHHDYKWGCGQPFDDVVFLLKNRIKTSNSHLGLDNLKEDVTCGLNLYSRPFSSGMILSNKTYSYGIYECKINVGANKNTTPSFWLSGVADAKSDYNEIDVFEGGAGDWTIHTNHTKKKGANNKRVGEFKTCSTLPGQSFGGNSVTYSVRWDPNKIIWYINGQKVRTLFDDCKATFKSNFSLVPNCPMTIIANNCVGKLNGNSSLYLENDEGGTCEVSYIKHWRRNQPPNHHGFKLDHYYVDFSINGNDFHFIECNKPLDIIYSPKRPIIIDLANSYLYDHNVLYRLFKQNSTNCQEGEILVAEGYVSLCALNNYEFNLLDPNNLITGTANSLILENNRTYRLEIEDPDCEWRLGWFSGENVVCHNQVQYFRTRPCEDRINFKINGISACVDDQPVDVLCINPIEIDDNHGKSRLILDISETIACDGNYLISVETSDITGQQPQVRDEVWKWISDDEKKYLRNLDLEHFTSGKLNLIPGKYYRIKVATASNQVWKSKTQLVYINPCEIVPEFEINGDLAHEVIVNKSDEIILDASMSTMCSSPYSYHVLDQNQIKIYDSGIKPFLNAWTYDTNNPDNQPEKARIENYEVGGFLLTKDLMSKGIRLACNSEYTIVLTIYNRYNHNDIRSISKKLILGECDNTNAEFQIRSSWCWADQCNSFRYAKGRTSINVGPPASANGARNYSDQNNLLLYSPELVSCDNNVSLTLLNSQGDLFGSKRLNYHDLDQIRTRGEFQVLAFFAREKDQFGNPENSYKINSDGNYTLVCSVDDRDGCGTLSEYDVDLVFSVDFSCPQGCLQGIQTRNSINTEKINFDSYYNTNSNAIIIDFNETKLTLDGEILLTSLDGKIINSIVKLNKLNHYKISRGTLTSGVYLVTFKTKDSVVNKKVIVN